MSNTRKPRSGAGTARISKILRDRKPELLLVSAALVIFAFVWGADALRPKPVEIFIPISSAVGDISSITAKPPASADTPQPGNTSPQQTNAATSPPAPQTTTRQAPQPTAAPGPVRVNINTADVEELQRLPGIGPVKAGAIAAYRAQHGIFLSPEELLNVKGIGPATLERMRPYLVF